MSEQIILYSNRICPFAQRAHIAALEKSVKFTYEQIPLSGEIGTGEKKGMQELFQWQNESLENLKKVKENYVKNINSTGEVPTVCVKGTNNNVTESDICIEFLEKQFKNQGIKLIPDDAYMESKGREVIKKTSNLIGGLYGLLTSPNAEVDKTKAKDIVANLEKLGNYLGEGPYFYGKDFSWVDVYFAPFFHRFSFLLPYYRDFDIFQTEGDYGYKNAKKVQSYAQALIARESLKNSIFEDQKYIDVYRFYANQFKWNESQTDYAGRGQSKWGQ